MNKRTLLILTALAVLGAVWRSYPHLTIPDLMPSDEYHYWFLLQYLVIYHRPYGGLFVPPLQLYIMWFLHSFFNIEVLTLCKYTNPVIGGLMVFPFYFFLSAFLDCRRSLYGSSLLIASENLFYRTCYFGTTEALGIFFMFLFLGLYLRRRYIYSIPFLIFTIMSHVVPFLFSVGYVSIRLLSNRRMWPVSIAILVGTVTFILSPFSPHKVQATNLLSGALHFSPSNLFLYSPRELIGVGAVSYLGLVVMGCNVPLRFWRWKEPQRTIFILSALAFIGAWLMYNTRVASPRRFLTYTAIALIPALVSSNTKRWVYPIVFVSMLSAPLLGGVNNFVWLSDSLTKPEVIALQWLDTNGYFANTTHKDWFGDRAVMQYISSRISLECFSNRSSTVVNPDWVKATKTLQDQKQFILNSTTDQQPWRYVFLSERMRRNAYFVITDWVRGTRSEMYHISVHDVWQDDHDWRMIYNHGGVVIYRRVDT
ncbi:MAG: hypothetical protein JRD89_00965 [Deltaproteobacteria bacterium]|nr:hypothetical protein [Deltaproteobacteria bacterium]